MKKLSTLLMASLLATQVAIARQLSPDEALSAALSQPDVSGILKTTTHGKLRPRLAYTAAAGATRLLYVFDRGASSGYVVVAADDVARPMLGYTDKGDFSIDSIPPALRWWLGCYAAEIKAAVSSGTGVAAQPVSTVSRTPIEPIVATMWNQDAPFNNLCPELDGERAVTGCVATAMAQVMKVHQWPATGTGTNSYSFTYNSTSHNVSLDFGATAYRWDDMLDVYDDNSPSAACDAVATLMYSCGVAVDMRYNLAKDGGSGAASLLAAVGLLKYFNYDKGMRYLQRTDYTLDEWCDIIYAELAAGRPVLYGGQSDEGGHEFVCDGYSEDGLFHINWGWGGASNGYFLLSALEPGSQGIGGSGGGYNANQDIIVGIRPPVAGSEVVPQMVQTGGFMTPYEQYPVEAGADVEFLSENGVFYSATIQDISATLGLKLTGADGTVSYIASASSLTLAPGYGTGGYVVPATSFPEGTYKVSPAFQCDGKWYDVSTPISANRSFTVTNDGSTVTFAQPVVPVALKVQSYSLMSDIYPDSYVHLTATVKNDGTEYYGSVIPVLASGNSIVAEGTADPVSIGAGESTTLSWVTKFVSQSTLAAGDYSLVFITADGYTVGGPYEVTVNAIPEGDASVAVTSVTVDGCLSGNGSVTAPFVVADPADMTVKVAMKGTGGYWADAVKLALAGSDGEVIGYIGDEFVGLKSGETMSSDMTGDVSSYDRDRVYMMVPWADHFGQIGNVSYFKLPDVTGIPDMTSASEIAVYPNPAVSVATVTSPYPMTRVVVYTLSGTMIRELLVEGSTSVDIDVEGLASGNYLIMVESEARHDALHLLKR